MNISFSPPDISELEIKYVSDALRSGWITTGPRVKKLEKELAAYTDNKAEAPNCVCLNSQTACSEAALRILGIGPGDEVITSAYTYTASASVVCHVGAKLVLLDIQPDHPEMDYEALEQAITERTKVIIPVDLGGVPCDYDRIFEIVEKKKALFRPANALQEAFGRVIVLADTAHAFGATWKGKKVGSVADLSGFSFHAVKNFTTGEGGAITWRSIPGFDDTDIYQRFQLHSLHGQSKDALAKLNPGAWEYDIVETGYKCNMTDIMAAIGQAQLERYPDLLARRKEIITRYDEAFHRIGILTLPHYTPEYESSGHLYITRIPGITSEQRNEIIVRMAENGIACNVHYKPLPMHTAYKKLGFDIDKYPHSYDYFINEITLPLHTRLTDEEIEYVIEQYVKTVKQYIN